MLTLNIAYPISINHFIIITNHFRFDHKKVAKKNKNKNKFINNVEEELTSIY